MQGASLGTCVLRSLCRSGPLLFLLSINWPYPMRNKFSPHEATEMCTRQQTGLTWWVHVDLNPADLICTFAQTSTQLLILCQTPRKNELCLFSSLLFSSLLHSHFLYLTTSQEFLYSVEKKQLWSTVALLLTAKGTFWLSITHCYVWCGGFCLNTSLWVYQETFYYKQMLQI